MVLRLTTNISCIGVSGAILPMELKFLQRHQLLNSVGKHIPTVVDEGRKFRTLLVMKLKAYQNG